MIEQFLIYYLVIAGCLALYAAIRIYIPVIWGLSVRKPDSVGGKYPYFSLMVTTILTFLAAPFLLKPILVDPRTFKVVLYNSLGEAA